LMRALLVEIFAGVPAPSSPPWVVLSSGRLCFQNVLFARYLGPLWWRFDPCEAAGQHRVEAWR
jgi:hypothetical protein